MTNNRKNNSIWKYGLHALEETLYHLDSILSWDSPIEDSRDALVKILPQLSRLQDDILDYIEEPCKSCDVQSCPHRPDSQEECIYYSDMIINQTIEEENENVRGPKICMECGGRDGFHGAGCTGHYVQTMLRKDCDCTENMSFNNLCEECRDKRSMSYEEEE